MFMKYFLFIFHFMFSVGFFMYIERKLLGLSHYRLGPNKVLIKGYLQFMLDMIKLLIKDCIEMFNFMMFSYFIMPLFLLTNMLLMWLVYPFNSLILNIEIGIIYLIVLMVLKMFYMVVMVFFIYSLYGLMSMIRMVVQVISYDIIIILIFLFNFIVYMDFSFDMYLNNFNSNFLLVNLVVFMFWILSIMVELIRLPYDFYEGESELISGFNIEYSSLYFLILVLVEYMEMIYFMMFTILIFLFHFCYYLCFNFFLFLFIFMLIWFRVFFVRYRMDKMLLVLWKFIFPLLMLIIFFYYYFNVL